MKFFFIFSYPLMAILNWTTSLLLARLGLPEAGEHGEPVSEKELRLMIRESHQHGHISRSEHSLINAVFEFDDMVCRKVMVLRSEVEFLDTNKPFAESIATAQRTKHTRFPLCNGTLDEAIGIVHIKDLVGIAASSDFDLSSIARPLKKVPENMPISKLLKHFQATHQLMAFVVDEFGNVIGIVTLENVLEEIIGDVDDEFDVKQEEILKEGPDTWIIHGGTPVEDVLRVLGITANDHEADTFSGLLTDLASKILSPGDEIQLDEFIARILEVRDDRATRVKVTRGQLDENPIEP
jgi:CBS domain containing-hemolysin-like protein